MKNLFYFLILVFMMVSCTSQNCKSVPDTFSSYNEVLSTINKTSFKIKDDVNTSKSSWIKKANYYSCNEVTGFMIIKTKKQNYIFENVPITIWNDFKKSSSFGKFYNKKIRNKYKLYLN